MGEQARRDQDDDAEAGIGEAMSDGLPITKAEASQIWKGSKETKRVVRALIDAGWEVFKQGKHYRAYCPCQDEKADTRVSCTPQNDGNHARRLLAAKSRCPDRHELIQ